MLLHMYQIFSSLLGHLHFFVHFSFTFVGQFFLGHPISDTVNFRFFKNDTFSEIMNCDKEKITGVKFFFSKLEFYFNLVR